MNIRSLLAPLLPALLLSACAGPVPAPWQRGDLARPEMAWEPDPLGSAARGQAYRSKEAATGGGTAAGGGCGCR
ncbi:DUF4266 domain-containing protein [Aquincola sp. MAHUQ-54]|uniref:DUF4266 domain-containing protein n=1 Tax=Aquincola agrisoli TaxID=3119538 RepID=A0AAW9Q525_9BURK